jgi:5'-nucleotidase/UDP-sugar diphosphatase
MINKSIALLGAALISSSALAGGPVDFYLTVLHNNDGESQLVSASGQPEYGGVARFATVVSNLRTAAMTFPAGANANGSILITSGDNFLAGPEFNASLNNGIPYYDTIALDLIGYDVCALGNHEFDFGPDILANFMDGFTDPSAPVFVSSNLDFTNEPALLAQETAGRLASSHVVTVNGRQVGVIGATTPTLTFISSPGNVAVGQDVLAAVQAEADALDANGVDIIILSSHLQGITEELALVSQLTKVDAVIAGGGDDLLANPSDLLVPGDVAAGTYPQYALDADLKSVPVVSTDGNYKYVGRMILGFDANGELVEVNSASGAVRICGEAGQPDVVAADPVVQAQVVDPVAAAVAAQDANIIAQSEVDLDGIRNNIRFIETNLGNLIADSQLYAATVRAQAFGTPAPDVALANGGGIRNNSVIDAGDFTELDTFDILPFANFVTVVPNIPPQQFKEILENCVSQVEGGDGTGRFGQIAGFRLVYDSTGTAQVIDVDGNITTAGTRVQSVILNDGRQIVRNGTVLPNAPSVNISIVNFLATGGDQYPFNDAPYTILGVTYQRALQEYIEDYLGGQITALEYPEGGENRIIDRGGRQESAVSTFTSIIRKLGERSRKEDYNGDGIVTIEDFGSALRR